MSRPHDAYLELAATAVDFELTPREQASLDEHLGGCPSCRRLAALIRADAHAIATLPAYVLPVHAYTRLSRRMRSTDTPSIGTLRLVIVATILTIAALGAVQVGAELIRRIEQQGELSLNIPDPARPSAGPPAVTPAPGEQAQFSAGMIVDVVVTGLRVRTLPTVDNTKSAKFEPLLGPGTQLRIIDGPVSADGYVWYRVEAIGSPQTGWVSSADHDGTPWIADARRPSPSAIVLTPEQRALMDRIRADAAVGCEPRSGPDPARAIVAIECRLRTSIVARVGVYAYPGAAEALKTYVERMAVAGVRSAGGDCVSGTQGDFRWGPDGAGGGRIGCFLDGNGSANIRLTCGAIGIGVLGRQDRMTELWEWTWAPQTGAPGTAPGICRLP